MKDYIVGIDFGHGETAAWIAPIVERNQIKMDKYGDSLMINRANDAEGRKIPSIVYQGRDGVFDLRQPAGAIIYTELKRKIKPIPERSSEDQEQYEAYAAFIRCVIKRLLENNEQFLRRNPENGEYNFDLCIAKPTRWSDDDTQNYLNFFNKEALYPLGLQVKWIINESDAAFFTFHNIVERHEITLVIDYGSSTIDYTVMQNNMKVSEDNWSNYQLGASQIEHEIIDNYKTLQYDEYQRCLNGQIQALSTSGIGYISEQQLMNDLHYRARCAKENSFSKDYYPNLGLFYFNYSVYLPPKYKSYFKGYTMEIDCDLADIIGDGKESKDEFKPNSKYVLAVEQDWRQLKEKIFECTGSNVDKVILSGGACIMKWVKPVVNQVFQKIPDTDTHPAYVVAKGIALYAKEQMNAEYQLVSKLNELDYEKIYIDSDYKATKEAIKELFGYVLSEIVRPLTLSRNDIRMKICDFFRGLNSNNVAYYRIVQEEQRKFINKEAGAKIRDIIKDSFDKEIELEDINIPIDAYIEPFEEANFQKGAFLYEKITDCINSCGGSEYSIDWNQSCNYQTKQEIVSSLNRFLLSSFWSETETKYTRDEKFSERCQKFKDQTIELGIKIFYNHQLFKTTFCE